VEVDANFTNLNNELGQKLVASDLTPYLTSATAASTYLTSATAASTYLTSANAASTYQTILTSGTTIKTVNGVSVLGSGNIAIDVGVTSFNTRTGAVTLSSGDVTTALGFTPYNATNPSGYITSSALSGYLPIGGGTLTGALAVGGDLSATGTIYTRAANGVMALNDSSANLEVRNVNGATGDSGMAMMRFHAQGAYGLKMGLRADGYFGIGGWSANSWRWYLNAANGDMTAAGNVTAYSDERLKKDWSDLPQDFVERLAEVKHGTYTRLDSGGRQAGSSAQAWLELLPEVVVEGNDKEKTLTLAYGNAALVSSIQLAKRVVLLEQKIASLLAGMNTQR
jgi:hypothetical protein